MHELGYQQEEERPAALADLDAAVQVFLWGDGGLAATDVETDQLVVISDHHPPLLPGICVEIKQLLRDSAFSSAQQGWGAVQLEGTEQDVARQHTPNRSRWVTAA